MLHDLFADDVVFLGATPGRCWHSIGWVETEQALHELFPSKEKISEVVTIDHHQVPGRYRISYRLRGYEANYGQFEYEQQAYYHTEDNKITRMRVLCSGLYKPQAHERQA
jgi:hypothetical protein